VQVEGPDTRGNDWMVSMIFVENDRVSNAVYAIKAVKRLGESTYALDIGESTLIRSYADSRDFSKGYSYDVAAGQRFTISCIMKARIYSIRTNRANVRNRLLCHSPRS
jgi:hypothetical protein